MSTSIVDDPEPYDDLRDERREYPSLDDARGAAVDRSETTRSGSSRRGSGHCRRR